jgi:hypothetical protein
MLGSGVAGGSPVDDIEFKGAQVLHGGAGEDRICGNGGGQPSRRLSPQPRLAQPEFPTSPPIASLKTLKHRIFIATARKDADSCAAGTAEPECRINPTSRDHMQSGPDRRARGRFHGNRPPPKQGNPQRSQSFDSNGPNVRLRGTAYQIFERYTALAREAERSDDRIAAENYYQHAEHYFRINNTGRESAQPAMPPRPTTTADYVDTNSSDVPPADVPADGAQSDGTR